MSISSLRDWFQSSIDTQTDFADMSVERDGIRAQVKIPTTDHVISQYNQKVPPTFTDNEISIIPKFESYYKVLDVIGVSYEDPVPLECIVKVRDYVPKKTRIRMTTKKEDGTEVEDWWEVTSVDMKRYDGVYSKIAKCVPYRPDYI